METEVLATLLGVALAALVAACGAGFRLVYHRLDRLEDKVDRLELKVDNLIMALARSGLLTDAQTVVPGAAHPAAGSPSALPQPARSPPPEPSGPEAAPA